METDTRDGAAVRLPPPLVYLAALVIGGVLHELVLPWRVALPLGLRIGLALAAFAGGLALGMGALGLFRRTGQNPKPWESTPEILSSGVYRFTRNPMYVGMALFQTAIGIAWANGWILALVPVSLVVVHFTAVLHEEAYLERKFGETYLTYKRSVRRWI
jgi:protein-S-isoprenylcysteine O-methyltransferase Ste14